MSRAELTEFVGAAEGGRGLARKRSGRTRFNPRWLFLVLVLVAAPRIWARTCQVRGGSLKATDEYFSSVISEDFASIAVFVDKRHGGVFKLTTERRPDDPVGEYAYEAPLLALSCADISTGVDPDGRRYISIPCLNGSRCVQAAWSGENISGSHPNFTAKAIVFYFAVDASQADALSKAFSHYLYLAQRQFRAR